jgi:hypothetical protein
MISVLVAFAVIFLAMSIIMSDGMRHDSGGVLTEHHEVPYLAPPAGPIREDAS